MAGAVAEVGTAERVASCADGCLAPLGNDGPYLEAAWEVNSAPSGAVVQAEAWMDDPWGAASCSSAALAYGEVGVVAPYLGVAVAVVAFPCPDELGTQDRSFAGKPLAAQRVGSNMGPPGAWGSYNRPYFACMVADACASHAPRPAAS